MSSTVSPAGSLAVTLAHAITYITRTLITRYSATTIIKLQLALEANLTAQFASSWVPTEPLRGSGRRCLTLSPNGVPPRPIYNACKTAGVEWSQWIATLGGVEFDLFIDPGCVSIRFGNWDSGKVTKPFTIWSQQPVVPVKAKKEISEQELQAQLRAQAQARAFGAKPAPLSPPKTVAQQLIEDDQDDELFTMIADEIREPTWMTPVKSDFPIAPIPRRAITSSPISVISTASTPSRSSSRSSNSSSGFSLFSHGSLDSYASATTVSTSSDDEKPTFKLSRRERARQARVFVDASKTEVTNYDGGKTTVLTGGVMLGGAAPKKPSTKKTTPSASGNWRTVRA
ncbi:hypothetical protein QCA50_002767 [Cerrena zonata]|uniref:Anti-proliferative protein domain-containing protein n=1 Tax=Cerrena zonata TaxID=2478898 RepID=A0AAW0GIN0_9APHY